MSYPGIRRWCVHGEKLYKCAQCITDEWEPEQARKRALQAMHDLCVYLFCEGITGGANDAINVLVLTNYGKGMLDGLEEAGVIE